MQPYPEWMNGDQLCAEAEIRSDVQDQRDAAIDEMADAILDAGDWNSPVPGIGSICDLATCMSEEWYAVQDQIMACMLAGQYSRAAALTHDARQIMRNEIIKQLTAREAVF